MEQFFVYFFRNRCHLLTITVNIHVLNLKTSFSYKPLTDSFSIDVRSSFEHKMSGI